MDLFIGNSAARNRPDFASSVLKFCSYKRFSADLIGHLLNVKIPIEHKRGIRLSCFLQDFPGFECWKTFAKNSNQTHKMFFGQVIFCHPACDVLKCVFLGVSTNVFLTCHLHLFTASWGQLRSDFPHYNAMVRYILWLNDKNNTKNMPRPGQSKGALEVDFTVPIVSPRQLHFTARP